MIRYVFYILCLISCFLFFAAPAFAQTEQSDQSETQIGIETKPEIYRESALRRFEIVFTISIPFTALHSYMAVRGVEMVRQRKVSPEMQKAHWNAIGGLTLLFSGFVAFRDWLVTRGEDISENIPSSRPISMFNTTESVTVYSGIENRSSGTKCSALLPLLSLCMKF